VLLSDWLSFVLCTLKEHFTDNKIIRLINLKLIICTTVINTKECFICRKMVTTRLNETFMLKCCCGRKLKKNLMLNNVKVHLAALWNVLKCLNPLTYWITYTLFSSRLLYLNMSITNNCFSTFTSWMAVYYSFDTFSDRSIWHSSNTSDLHLGGTWFEFLPRPAIMTDVFCSSPLFKPYNILIGCDIYLSRSVQVIFQFPLYLICHHILKLLNI
jgi:hypothetical protein